jgi:hypothetical protein
LPPSSCSKKKSSEQVSTRVLLLGFSTTLKMEAECPPKHRYISVRPQDVTVVRIPDLTYVKHGLSVIIRLVQLCSCQPYNKWKTDEKRNSLCHPQIPCTFAVYYIHVTNINASINKRLMDVICAHISSRAMKNFRHRTGLPAKSHML